MTLTRRKFTPEDRLSKLQEGEREGHTTTIRKYHLAPSLYARWKRKYLNEGIHDLRDNPRRIDPEIQALELDNECLRRIITKQGLEIEIKTELSKELLPG